MEKIKLKNGTSVILKVNKNTPRCAFVCSFAIGKGEKKAGIYSLMTRLFMQGTKNRTAQEIADESEENAIDITTDMKIDYVRFKGLCLNEDFDYMLELLQDIIFNSTFEDFEKEVEKLKGEIKAELDSPKTKAFDDYFRTIYENHAYGNTYTKILEDIDGITKDDVKEAFDEILKTSRKTISVVGDFDKKEMRNKLEVHFGNFENNAGFENAVLPAKLDKDKIVFTEKEDANQAQIIEGRIIPTYGSEDYAIITVINSLLGASGLSSRLFTELREKQGLAYSVRSMYDCHNKSAVFGVYIGTQPGNIKTAVEGIGREIEKLKTIKVPEDELEDAKNNIIGKRGFYTETNMLTASVVAAYESENLGYDYEKKFIEDVKNVTSEKIFECASKYFSTPKVLVVSAPKKYIDSVRNERL